MIRLNCTLPFRPELHFTISLCSFLADNPGSTATASDNQQTQAPATGPLSGITQATQSRCAEVAGRYPVSADRWVPARSSQPCPKMTAIEIFSNCEVIVSNVNGVKVSAVSWNSQCCRVRCTIINRSQCCCQTACAAFPAQG